MECHLNGKTVLIVQGSLLAGPELQNAFGRAGARVFLTANIINAFGLLKRVAFDGAVIDQGLHNEAFDLCSELRELGVPYICCSAPHRLQKPAARLRDAAHAVWRLGDVLSAKTGVPAEHLQGEHPGSDRRWPADGARLDARDRATP
ncbi:MAG TPA: hypothetical protein VG900_11975 [Hyphomicrobiaceae bacterium]|jgi:hypothetical protein|nr:hypothetical protein [Hyphomicrobiaceae bacterium]